MFTFKKISIALLVLTVLFVLFGVVATVQAQYGFSKLLGVGGLEQASVGEIIIRIIQWIMGIVGLVCVAFIIYGGVMYATSGGSEEHVERAKKILLWSIIGLVICILAFVIANAVVGAIRGGTTGGGGEGEGSCMDCNSTYTRAWVGQGSYIDSTNTNCYHGRDMINNANISGLSCYCEQGAGAASDNWYLRCNIKDCGSVMGCKNLRVDNNLHPQVCKCVPCP